MSENKIVFWGCCAIEDVLDKEAKEIVWENSFFQEKVKDLDIFDDILQNTLPDFWKTQEEFINAKEYVLKIYKIVLKELAEKLDEIHGTEFGEKGWNVLLYDWLESYIASLYDKLCRIKYALNRYGELYILESNEYYISELPNRSLDVEMNEILHYQQYLDLFYALGLQVKRRNNKESEAGNYFKIIRKAENTKVVSKCSVSKRIKTKLRLMLQFREPTTYICTSYLPFHHGELDTLSFGRIRTLNFPNILGKQQELNMNMRKKLIVQKKYNDELVTILFQCIWKEIPIIYMEGLKGLITEYLRMNIKIPKVIFDSTRIYSDFIEKLLVVDTIKKGGRLNLVQHGGNFCIEKYVDYWQFDIASKFYSWGVQVNNKKWNICRMPAAKLLNLKMRKKGNKGKHILYAGYSGYPYVQRFILFYEIQISSFFSSEENFFKHLNKEVMREMIVRTYPTDFGWRRKERLKTRFPQMIFDNNEDYYKSLSDSKLVITSRISTTFLEAMYMGIPTIVIYSEKYFIQEENVKEIFEEMKQEKVFVEDPQEAALLINEIYDHVEEWWNERERQKIISKFINVCAYKGCFPKLKWIREIYKESKC